MDVSAEKRIRRETLWKEQSSQYNHRVFLIEQGANEVIQALFCYNHRFKRS